MRQVSDLFIKSVTDAYLNAVDFTDGEELGDASFSILFLSEAVADVTKFLQESPIDLDQYDHEQIGHDFWLTRNGHGAGFWDRPEIYGETECNTLTEYAKTFGAKDTYVGDDGMIY